MGNCNFKYISRDSQFRQLTAGTKSIKLIVNPYISPIYKDMCLNQMIQRNIISRDGDTFIITLHNEAERKRMSDILIKERLIFSS